MYCILLCLLVCAVTTQLCLHRGYHQSTYYYRIVETFEEENFRGFHGFGAIHESFLCEILGVWRLGVGRQANVLISIENHCHVLRRSACTSEHPRKFSPRNFIFHQSAKVFSLESFPLYGIMFPPLNTSHTWYNVVYTSCCTCLGD